jgi:predicted Zn finger-like uncharacterized protein
MDISCPGCGFKGSVPDDKIPEAGRNLTCPKCKHSFFIRKTKSQELLKDEDVKKLHRVTMTSAGGKTGILDRFVSFIQPKEMAQRAKTLNTFRAIFAEAVKDGVLTEKEIEYMKMYAQRKSLDWSEAVRSVRAEAIKHMNEYISFAKNDGVIDDTEYEYIDKLLALLKFHPNYIASVRREIDHIKTLENIGKGNLPMVQEPQVILKSSEICHYQAGNTVFVKADAGDKYLLGTFLITSERLLFVSEGKSFHIAIKQIMNINCYSEYVKVNATIQKASGYYKVKDPEVASEILLFLLKKVNMHVVEQSDITKSRHIPQDVKINVWQRDGGRCVYCGAEDYLEFDHIIPFSKGGSSTEQNIQLLCRRCNSQKGAEL